MVSKILKKPATKNKPMPVKRCRTIRRRHRRNSYLKRAAGAGSSVVLTRIGSHKGFKIIRKTKSRETRLGPEPETRIRRNLPPLISPENRTVFLDLDETLVHSVTGPPPKNFDFVVRPIIRGKVMTFYVVKRPGVDLFLEKLAAKYEVVVFTAGLREYATLVLDRLDRKRVVSHRLYRDACKEVNGKFVKDLAGLGRDLKRLIIVDDNPNAYFFQPENAVPVLPFVGDPSDRELGRLLEFFEGEGTNCCEDIRDAVKQFFGDDASVSSSSDDGDGDGDGDGDDNDEVEDMGDAKNKLPPILTISAPCSVIQICQIYPFRLPILEFRTKMVILFCFFLLFYSCNLVLSHRNSHTF